MFHAIGIPCQTMPMAIAHMAACPPVTHPRSSILACIPRGWLQRVLCLFGAYYNFHALLTMCRLCFHRRCRASSKYGTLRAWHDPCTRCRLMRPSSTPWTVLAGRCEWAAQHAAMHLRSSQPRRHWTTIVTALMHLLRVCHQENLLCAVQYSQR